MHREYVYFGILPAYGRKILSFFFPLLPPSSLFSDPPPLTSSSVAGHKALVSLVSCSPVQRLTSPRIESSHAPRSCRFSPQTYASLISALVRGNSTRSIRTETRERLCGAGPCIIFSKETSTPRGRLRFRLPSSQAPHRNAPVHSEAGLVQHTRPPRQDARCFSRDRSRHRARSDRSRLRARRFHFLAAACLARAQIRHLRGCRRQGNSRVDKGVLVQMAQDLHRALCPLK